MSIEDIKMIAAYMTANSEKEDESCAIGHCVMNKAIKYNTCTIPKVHDRTCVLSTYL